MINSFRGEYRFLSNFSQSRIKLDGFVYTTVEHAFQAAKTLDMQCRGEICAAGSPGSAKALGRRVPLRLGWEDMKVDVMYRLLQEKFKDPYLREYLLATGDEELVEGNTWGDTFWGVCRGEGQNWLGKLLMQVREEIKSI